MALNFRSYRPDGFYDELVGAHGVPRPWSSTLIEHLSRLDAAELNLRRAALNAAMVTMGITFTVYSEGDNIDRARPFDIVPRVMPRHEWRRIDAGLNQRLNALQLFIDDLYKQQSITNDGVLPAEIIARSRNSRRQCVGHTPRSGVWAPIWRTDLVRDRDGAIYGLEDNLRVPSGVAYMLENRLLMKSLLPELFEACEILPVDDYTTRRYDCLAALSPRPGERPVIAALTPGIDHSAYFEHSYLAQQMGAVLVEGSDLIVASDDCVYMKTIDGLRHIHVIYRRIDDDYLDPNALRRDSTLGVRGLLRAWRRGKVGIANAPGAGVADDKVICTFVPQIIRYHLDEDPVIPNMPSYLCTDVRDREYVLALSTAPTLPGDGLAPRHLDLRPFVLQSDCHYLTTGGLSRVAMREGSLVVNASQGRGSKNTWIVEERA